MTARPKLTPEDFIRLSELVENFETAGNALLSEVFRLLPKNHPASRFLSGPTFVRGFASKLKDSLEDSARPHFCDGPLSQGTVSKLFYGPDRAQAREDALDYRR